MEFTNEMYQITIAIIVLAVLMAVAAYFTKSGRNFRSSRNRKARKQHKL